MWDVGEHLGDLESQGPDGHTYPGHVGGVASLVVCQVSGMVVAAGHGEGGRAGYPPPLSPVPQRSHGFLSAPGGEMA